MKSYDYAHRQGVRPLSWEDVTTLASRLVEELAAMQIDLIIGIARAGLIPATLVACNLRRELFPVRVTRRENDEVRFPQPVWKVPVSPEVAGKRVAVIDEIADTGETLALVARRVLELGATGVVTACLVRHSWADPTPTLTSLVTDELVIFPWDQRVFTDGQWQPHPEIVSAIEAQREH